MYMRMKLITYLKLNKVYALFACMPMYLMSEQDHLNMNKVHRKMIKLMILVVRLTKSK